MCGFIVSKGSKCEASALKLCLKEAVYRGPDNSDIYLHNDVTMGHNRLRIVDLSDRSSQPMLSDCKDYVIVYNGEIYNAHSLSKKYDLNLKTSSDTFVRRNCENLCHG